MLPHMRTTVDLADGLLVGAKRAARERGVTLRTVFEEALRRFLGESARRGKYRLRDRSFGGRGLQPGIREGDWRQIRALIYQGRGG